MGFSSPQGGGDKPAAPTSNLGSSVLNYMQQRYPIAGGLANAAFGSSVQGVQQPAQEAQAPVMDQGTMPDYSQMLSMNAKPPSSNGGGLATILKLIGI